MKSNVTFHNLNRAIFSLSEVCFICDEYQIIRDIALTSGIFSMSRCLFHRARSMKAETMPSMPVSLAIAIFAAWKSRLLTMKNTRRAIRDGGNDFRRICPCIATP